VCGSTAVGCQFNCLRLSCLSTIFVGSFVCEVPESRASRHFFGHDARVSVGAELSFCLRAHVRFFLSQSCFKKPNAKKHAGNSVYARVFASRCCVILKAIIILQNLSVYFLPILPFDFGFIQTHLTLATFLFSRATRFLHDTTTRVRWLCLTICCQVSHATRHYKD